MNPGASLPALQPRTESEVVSMVRNSPRLHPMGGGSKPALAAPPPGCAPMTLRGLTGIVEYDPGEYTLTARAGTPLREVAEALGRNGQYLPFDPPFADAGATLGGAVGAGLSGPGRYRYGGVRDFILGVRFVTGSGELVRAGGKVVKNAAGFDIPKLMVGSLGRLGVIVEVSFKVFPRPRAMATWRADYPGLGAALEALARINASNFDVEALELETPARLWVRLGGDPATFAERFDRLSVLAAPAAGAGVLQGQDDESAWAALAPRIPAGMRGLLAKVALTASAVQDLDGALEAAGAGRRYSSAANLAWVSWPAEAEALSELLASRGLAGLVIAGNSPRAILGKTRGDSFRARVKGALDPEGRFASFP